MQATKAIQQLINNSMSGMHTAFLAKIVSVSDVYATVQPLFMIRDATGELKKMSVVSNIPIIASARYKVICKNINGENVLTAQPLNSGDVVLCIACEKDITEAKQGLYDTSTLLSFSISSSVVVGVL